MLEESELKRIEEISGDKDLTIKVKTLETISGLINDGEYEKALLEIDKIFKNHRLWLYDYLFGNIIIIGKAMCILALNGIKEPTVEQIVERISNEDLTNYLKIKAKEYANNEYKMVVEALKKNGEKTEV